MNVVNPRSYEIIGVGKFIKNSKMKYRWNFDLYENVFTLDLYHSKKSKKIEIQINGNIVFKNRGIDKNNFNFKIKKEKCDLLIYKPINSKEFVLKINNKTFKEYLDEKKNLGNNKSYAISGIGLKKKNNINNIINDKSDLKNKKSFAIENSDVYFEENLVFLPIQNPDEKEDIIKLVNLNQN